MNEREADRVARLLMAEWERVEGSRPNVSYVATFADLARVVVADSAALVAKARSDALREAARDMRRNPLGLGVLECADVLDERADHLRAAASSHPTGNQP